MFPLFDRLQSLCAWCKHLSGRLQSLCDADVLYLGVGVEVDAVMAVLLQAQYEQHANKWSNMHGCVWFLYTAHAVQCDSTK